MKLTKTQRQLIDAAAARGGVYSIECGGGRGPYGGAISYGNRERAAVLALVDAGLARIVHRSSSTDYNRGYGVRSTILAFELITPAAPAAAPICPHCGRDLEDEVELAAGLCTSDDCPRLDP